MSAEQLSIRKHENRVKPFVHTILWSWTQTPLRQIIYLSADQLSCVHKKQITLEKAQTSG